MLLRTLIAKHPLVFTGLTLAILIGFCFLASNAIAGWEDMVVNKLTETRTKLKTILQAVVVLAVLITIGLFLSGRPHWRYAIIVAGVGIALSAFNEISDWILRG